LLEEVAVRLSSQGVGSTAAGSTGWLIIGREFHPSTNYPRQIAIVPTGGFGQEFSEVDKRSFQVLVRAASTGSSGLEAKVDAVDSALNIHSGTLSGRVYLDIQRQGDRIYVGRDENHRPVYSLNYLAWRSQTT
jgi:hypothetical protein